MSHKLYGRIAVIGIDIGKNSFHVVGQDRRRAIVVRQKPPGLVEARGGDHSPPGKSVLAIDVFSFSLFSSSLSRRFLHRASGFRKIPSHISGESLIACDKRRHENRVSEKSRAVMLRSCNMSGWEEDFFSADLHDHTKLKEHDASKFSEDCMHRGRALGWIAFMIFCSPVASVTAEEKKPANAIRVLEATYGGNCAGVAKGNVTKFIASACDGTDLCNYRVYYKNMGGDPAAGCKKAFRVAYVCGKNTKNPETCALEAEAGKGW